MLGSGVPGEDTILTWDDPQPLEDIQYIGLSAWDKHVSYRQITLGPALPPNIIRQQQKLQQQQQSGPPSGICEPSRVQSLAVLCCEQLTKHVKPVHVCPGLVLAEVLTPVADLIKPALMDVLIASLAQILQNHSRAFCTLGEETIQDLLSSDLQVRDLNWTHVHGKQPCQHSWQLALNSRPYGTAMLHMHWTQLGCCDRCLESRSFWR